MKRRDFVQAGIIAPILLSDKIKSEPMEKVFIHHVFFWLNDAKDSDKLIEGLKGLSTVPTIKKFHIGVPANTDRDVIDASYGVSWLCQFENPEDQEVYQKHQIHLDFIDKCSSLWSKVLVYDSVPV